MGSKAMIAIHARDPGNRRHLGFVRRSQLCVFFKPLKKRLSISQNGKVKGSRTIKLKIFVYLLLNL